MQAAFSNVSSYHKPIITIVDINGLGLDQRNVAQQLAAMERRHPQYKNLGYVASDMFSVYINGRQNMPDFHDTPWMRSRGKLMIQKSNK